VVFDFRLRINFTAQGSGWTAQSIEPGKCLRQCGGQQFNFYYHRSAVAMQVMLRLPVTQPFQEKNHDR
jgi:hypothetical protein